MKWIRCWNRSLNIQEASECQHDMKVVWGGGQSAAEKTQVCEMADAIRVFHKRVIIDYAVYG